MYVNTLHTHVCKHTAYAHTYVPTYTFVYQAGTTPGMYACKVPVDAVDGGALVVPSQHEKILRVLDLVGEEEADALQALRPTIDVVAQKEVVGLRRESSVFKQAQKVGVSTRARTRTHTLAMS